MFKRKPTERKTEAKRATKNISSIDIKDKVGAKLGINRAGRNIDKIAFEINRNRKYLKQWGITDDDLKQLGLE